MSALATFLSFILIACAIVWARHNRNYARPLVILIPILSLWVFAFLFGGCELVVGVIAYCLVMS